MPWFKIDDGFHGHPKVMELSPAAVGIWTLAGTWCASYLTDGQIKHTIVRRLGGEPGMIQELVDAGLWIQDGNTYQFKDWEDYQPMKADVEAEREASRERMRKVRAQRKGTTTERSEDVRPNFSRSSEEVRLTPTQPDPTLNNTSSPATPPEEFNTFWDTYPKKVAKQAALKAWNKATKISNPQEIIDGSKRYAELITQEKTEKQFIKSPDGWLNAGRWDDELPTPTKPKHNPLWD